MLKDRPHHYAAVGIIPACDNRKVSWDCKSTLVENMSVGAEHCRWALKDIKLTEMCD